MKKTLLISAIIIMLIGAMFILTGCGSEEVATNNTTDDSTTSNVIQVPMTIVNMYPETNITELYLSGAGQENWGTELLGGQVLATGTQIPLVFNVDAQNLQWDLKAVDQAGTAVEFRNIDLTNINTTGGTITLQADENGAPVAVAQ